MGCFRGAARQVDTRLPRRCGSQPPKRSRQAGLLGLDEITAPVVAPFLRASERAAPDMAGKVPTAATCHCRLRRRAGNHYRQSTSRGLARCSQASADISRQYWIEQRRRCRTSPGSRSRGTTSPGVPSAKRSCRGSRSATPAEPPSRAAEPSRAGRRGSLDQRRRPIECHDGSLRNTNSYEDFMARGRSRCS